MKRLLPSLCALILATGVTANVSAQVFLNDNDGLLDVGEAPGFPRDPAAATGELYLHQQGLQDLDGTRLLVNLESLSLRDNKELTSIERGDFEGLTKLQELKLNANSITSIEPGAFGGLDNLKSLDLRGNEIISIEPGGFDGLDNLQTLRLATNSIASIDSDVFHRLTNLRTLDLRFNDIASIESGAFAGLNGLETLTLGDNSLSELNLTAATFDSLQPGKIWFGFPEGFLVSNNDITALSLDAAQLSRSSFDVIVNETSSIIDASLIGLTFSDEKPSDLSLLLGIPTLDNVSVDSNLFASYEAEFEAFAAMPGNTVTVVPEPSGFAAVLIMSMGATVIARRGTRRGFAAAIERPTNSG